MGCVVWFTWIITSLLWVILYSCLHMSMQCLFMSMPCRQRPLQLQNSLQSGAFSICRWDWSLVIYCLVHQFHIHNTLCGWYWKPGCEEIAFRLTGKEEFWNSLLWWWWCSLTWICGCGVSIWSCVGTLVHVAVVPRTMSLTWTSVIGLRCFRGIMVFCLVCESQAFGRGFFDMYRVCTWLTLSNNNKNLKSMLPLFYIWYFRQTMELENELYLFIVLKFEVGFEMYHNPT